MAERRLPLTVTDDEGVRHQGEVLVVRRWRPDLTASPGCDFTIVLAGEPPARHGPPPDAPGVAVCVPAVPVRLPTTIGEPAVQYGEPSGRPPIRLPAGARDAYACGTVLSARPLAVSARAVFEENGAPPRLDLLARELLAASRRAERYWQALDGVLSWPRQLAPVPDAHRLRARLRDVLRRVPADRAAREDALDRLRRVQAGAPPEAIAPSAAALAEDAAYARCLTGQPDAAEELARLRAYLDAGAPGPDLRALTVDHAATHEQLSFVTLLCEPNRLEGMRAAFETFRAGYAAVYLRHHEAYWRALARIAAALEQAAPAARALERLNGLSALGRPVGRPALATFERLVQRRAGCARGDLEAVLRDRPACPECGLSLADGAPHDEAEDVVRRLREALARQQARLASEAVRRILARGGERLEQFLQIVQASDQAGLVQVLDDDLLAFLRELLSQPVAPTPEALDLFEELARAYPVVHAGEIDAVAETFRRLLRERLRTRAGGGAEGSVRLGTPPRP